MKTTAFCSLTLGLLVAATPHLSAAAPAPDAASLRTKASKIIGPLPDKMKGAEADTPAMIELGKKLYFDPILSSNKKQSCNDCHRLDEGRAGVDNQPTSEGAFGKRGDRNSPTTLNAGFHFRQFWDGRADDLVAQAKGPVLNPVEMAMPTEAEVVQRLKGAPGYPAMFAKAFPGAESVNYENMARAIAAFERTLITHDRFDDFLKGNDKALSAPELAGLDLFLTAGCTTCHNGPAVGGTSFQKVGLVNAYTNTTDVGRFGVTKDDDDKQKFKVPSLRNIALTGPYFHHGKIAKLDEVVQLMGYLQLDRKFTDEETKALVAFLNALSDKERGRAATARKS